MIISTTPEKNNIHLITWSIFYKRWNTVIELKLLRFSLNINCLQCHLWRETWKKITLVRERMWEFKHPHNPTPNKPPIVRVITWTVTILWLPYHLLSLLRKCCCCSEFGIQLISSCKSILSFCLQILHLFLDCIHFETWCLDLK